MTNKQFDECLRRRIETEDMKMQPASERRIAAALERPQNAPRIRRLSMKTVVLAAVLLALLCGAALAAVNWNSRQFLTHTDKDGNAVVNDALVSHVQPVDQRFAGDVLTIDIVDAIFDGNALVLTWTNTSSAAESVYILCDVRINGRGPGMGGYRGVDELFIAPGETIESGLMTRTDEDGGDAAPAERCDVALTFTAFAPNGEVVDLAPLDGESTEADRARQNAWIDEQVALGNVVLAGDGVIELGSNAPYHEGMTRVEALTASGLMTPVDTVTASFGIARNAYPQSALPKGEPIEQDNGGYTLRVVRADLTPNAGTFVLERVFADAAAAQAYAAYYSEKLGPYWGFEFIDETGDIWWAGNSGGGAQTEAPVEQPDGTWVWAYGAAMTDIQRPPKTLTILPVRDDPETGEHNVPYPDEALTLTFE